jgi:hypothetical protein
VLVAGSVAAIVNFTLCRRLLALSWRDVAKTFLYALAGTTTCVAFVLVVRNSFGDLPLAAAGIAIELLLAGAAVVVYVVTVIGVWHLVGRPNDPALRLFQFVHTLVVRTP